MAPFLSRGFPRFLSSGSVQSLLLIANFGLLLYFIGNSWLFFGSCKSWIEERVTSVEPCPVPGGNVWPRNYPSKCRGVPKIPNVFHIIFPPSTPTGSSQPTQHKFTAWNYFAIKSIVHHAKPDLIFLHHPASHPALRSPWLTLAKRHMTDSVIPDDAESPDRGPPSTRDLLPQNILRRNGGYLVNPSFILMRNLSHLSHHGGIIPQSWDGDEAWFLPTKRDMEGSGNEIGNRFALDWNLLVGMAWDSEFVKEWLRESQNGWWWWRDERTPEERANQLEWSDSPGAKLHRIAMRHTESVKVLRAASFAAVEDQQGVLHAFARAAMEEKGGMHSVLPPAAAGTGPEGKGGFFWKPYLSSNLPSLLGVLVQPPLWSDEQFGLLLEGKAKLASGDNALGAWDQKDLSKTMKEIVGGDLEEVRKLLKGEGLS
ncbi:hypothetical protein M427DRAFT_157717 [Gonapodya prolifera JEL478]|uniref:Uncharacterized protein n=1 Tax=Gonapodya prolifera (strain JEL478) TaxID=1344416 RepID=A0A139A4Y6_GONPJ|nr:hypothetical protein M427DRAFT_157717 [Gonapodya prolifera JEL478]|eukprot:KXS11877.1 hypothetical protein M427DRAFT_157717 [Gonapodya prolifera JEL478]